MLTRDGNGNLLREEAASVRLRGRREAAAEAGENVLLEADGLLAEAARYTDSPGLLGRAGERAAEWGDAVLRI